MLILKFLIHRPLTHFRSLQTTWLKKCWLQLDSNSVCRSRRLARWPPRPISNFTIALHKKKAPILNGHLRLLNHKSCWIQNDKSLTLGFTTTQSVRPDDKIFFKIWLFGTMKTWPIALKLAKISSKLCPKLNQPSENARGFINDTNWLNVSQQNMITLTTTKDDYLSHHLNLPPTSHCCLLPKQSSDPKID